MTGRTHVAVGTASALVFTKPQNLKELTLCLGAAVIGALICDIDVKSTKSHKTVSRIIPLTIITLVLGAYMEYRWNVGIIKTFHKDSNELRLVGGFMLFLVICGFGKSTPHRSFMHSIVALFLLTGAVYIMFPTVTVYFGIAMCSHMILDTFNYTNVHLFYPLQGGISFNICHAKGPINDCVGYAAMGVILVEGISFIRNFIV